MSLFNIRPSLPGGYGQVITEPVNSGAPALTSIGVVGAANSGPMETPLTFSSADSLVNTLGTCEAVDYIKASWSNGGGTVKFVRVGATHVFDEVWMDDQATSATDISETVMREYGSSLIFDTGANDWLYVGKQDQFSSVNIDFISDGLDYGGAAARDLEAQYYNGAWTSLNVLEDNTVVSSQTLQQSGDFSFTAPGDWQEVAAPVEGGGASALFWVRFRPLQGAAVAGSLANLIVATKNALPAYGHIKDQWPFTDAITSSNAAGTTLTDTGHTGMRATFLVTSGTADATTSTTALNDADATFITDGIRAGYYVRNTTENSTVQVVSVTSETQIVTEAVTDWSGDGYAVYSGGYDFAESKIQVGDTVTNESDGSSALVLSVDSADAITTTALTGGYNNGYFAGSTVTTQTLVGIVTGGSLDAAPSASGSYYILTDTGANFVTNRVAPNDVVVNTTQTPDSTATVISVISESQIVVSSLAGNTVDTWGSADVFGVLSRKVLKSSGTTNFVTNGVRPGQVLTLEGGGTTEVVSVISNTIVITTGVQGGTSDPYYGELGTITGGVADVSYTKTADQYTIEVEDEKIYLEAVEPGIAGRDIAVEVYTIGSQIHTVISNGLYVETFKVYTADDDNILTLVADINANSSLVTAERVTGVGTGEMPATMTQENLEGGSNGSATTEDYIKGLDLLLAEEDIGVVYVAADATDAINAALKAHVGTAAGQEYQLPRIAICAKPEDEEFLRVGPGLQAEASAMSYDGRVAYVIQRATIQSSSSASGLLTTRTALVAAVAGRLTSLPPATPMTSKLINVQGIDKKFNKSDKSTLIDYGILAFDQTAGGITCVRSVSATTNSSYYELSVRRVVDVTEVTVRNTLADLYVGRVAEPGILGQIKSTTETLLSGLVRSAGGATLRDWRNVFVSFNSQDYTRVDISYEVLPLTPINFVFTTMFVHSGITFET